MPEISRTLVKSVPELWAELSDPEALGRHLEAFGPLAITAAQPERELAWEAERASGTIRLEPAGFGTRLRLETEIGLAAPVAEEQAPEPEAPEPVPEAQAAEPEPAPEPRGFFARLWRRRPEPEPAPPPEAVAPPPPPPPPPPPAREPLIDPAAAEAALTGMLDALGAARHRPFSRA